MIEMKFINRGLLIVMLAWAGLAVFPVATACTQTSTKTAPAVSSKVINAAQLLEDVRALSRR